MKRIRTFSGQYALVDDDDYASLSQFQWYFAAGYAVRKDKKKTILMHREIIQTPDGLDTDHINRNKLDNRRGNLRIATRSQNMLNQDKQGVYWSSRAKKWSAQICFKGIKHYLGLFTKREDAASAYQRKKSELTNQSHG